MKRIILGIALLGVLPLVVSGQEQESSERRARRRAERRSLAQEPTSPRPSPSGETVTLQAENQEQVEKGYVKASGYVAIVSGDIRLQADRVDFWNEEMKLVAEGNVVFQQGDQKIVGDRMEVNLDDGTGKFYNAYGNAGSDLFFHGDVVERVSDDVYVIERGAFTACAQPVPRWRFTAGKAVVRRDHHVSLHSAFLKVKSLPVFYLPYAYYPIDEQGRSTGFLLPKIGNSTFKGFLLSQGFFWAINRSMDATVNADWFSEFGVGVGTNYRYVLSDSSRGDIQSYFLRDKETDSREWELRTSLNQDLPKQFRLISRVDYFSSFDFQQTFQENFDRATRRSKRASVNISRSWSDYTFRFLYDRSETDFSGETALRQTLPRLSLGTRQKAIGSSPILFGFDTSWSGFARTLRDERVDYARFDFLPTLSYPFNRLAWLTFRTTYNPRYTHYTGRLDEAGDFLDDGIDRSYQELRVDMRGPILARIFDTPGNFYSDRYKHTIEPQLVWSYRSRVDDFDNIPKFDGEDFIPGTNQLSFSLVNRFFAKKVVGNRDVEVPVEFLTWTLRQRYFFDVNASLYDRQFSTPFFTADGVPSNFSPITSRLQFRPDRRMSATWNLEYDVNFGAIRSNSIVASFSSPGWGSVNGAWTQRSLLPSDQVRRNFRAASTVNLGGKVQTRFETAYDVTLDRLQLLTAGVQYNVQCCGFDFQWSRYNFGRFRNENTFRFGVTLANIGSFGTSLGGQGRVQ